VVGGGVAMMGGCRGWTSWVGIVSGHCGWASWMVVVVVEEGGCCLLMCLLIWVGAMVHRIYRGHFIVFQWLLGAAVRVFSRDVSWRQVFNSHT